MKFTILATAVLASVGLAVAQEELKIDKTFVPTSGCERTTKAGDGLTMEYKGSLTDGSVFDKSYGRAPFKFKLGAGQVIQGWDKGLLDMCIGEKRTLTIPPELGYGSRGAGGVIPGGATLIFEVELLGIDGYTPPKEGAGPAHGEDNHEHVDL